VRIRSASDSVCITAKLTHERTFEEELDETVAPERLPGDSAIDECDRDPSDLTFAQKVWPKLRFHYQDGYRINLRKCAAHRPGPIERKIEDFVSFVSKNVVGEFCPVHDGRNYDHVLETVSKALTSGRQPDFANGNTVKPEAAVFYC